MKRSRSVQLTLMGLASGVLAGCGSEPTDEVLSFKDVQECVDSGVFAATECETQYRNALAAHQQEAPRYKYEDICEADFGYNQCQRSSNGFWMPFMAGYMMSMVAERVSDAVRYRSHYSRPLYRSRDDYWNYRTSDNYPVGGYGYSGNSTRLPRTVMTTVPNNSNTIKSSSGQYGAKAKTISRGGFGSKSAARGGWGS